MPAAKRRPVAPANAHEHPKGAREETRDPGTGEPAKGAVRSRHYRRAQRDRGAETRARLIEAALDVFGRFGFEGASTRQIAKEAGANLAAIVYHFGSKEALHIAVAEHIAKRIHERVGAAIIAASVPDAAATPAAARAALNRLFETYADVMLGTAEAERWARFIVREQMQPTAAFEVIYAYMGNSHGVGCRLVGVVLGRDPAEESLRLLVFAMFGQVLVFRVAQALVLRRLGWPSIGERERTEIKRIIIANVDAILTAEGRT